MNIIRGIYNFQFVLEQQRNKTQFVEAKQLNDALVNKNWTQKFPK